MAKRAQPALYDTDTLLHLTYQPVSIWDSEEVLIQQVVSMKKINEKPRHVRPENGFYEKLNALKFVPQKEHSWRSGVLALSQNEIDSLAIQLKDTITSLRFALDGLKVEHVSLKRRYDELSKANTHSRPAYTEKLSAFTAENTKLKAQISLRFRSTTVLHSLNDVLSAFTSLLAYKSLFNEVMVMASSVESSEFRDIERIGSEKSCQRITMLKYAKVIYYFDQGWKSSSDEKFIVKDSTSLNASVARRKIMERSCDKETSPLVLSLKRSFVHTLPEKTYYELLKGKKPNLQYFRVFGSLCYPTNDYDDVGKAQGQ
ncbi:hypothetical protein Tco_0902754 [Tanacetum coccineum]